MPDRIVDDTKPPEEMKTFARDLDDWKFFCTEDTMRSQAFNGVFKGLRLPKAIVDKIYYTNAVNWFAHFK